MNRKPLRFDNDSNWLHANGASVNTISSRRGTVLETCYSLSTVLQLSRCVLLQLLMYPGWLYPVATPVPFTATMLSGSKFWLLFPQPIAGDSLEAPHPQTFLQPVQCSSTLWPRPTHTRGRCDMDMVRHVFL